MTEQLTRFVERMADVPTQLRRRLAFIRDLDGKTQRLQSQIEDECKKLAAKIENPEEPEIPDALTSRKRKRSNFDFESATKKLLGIADEKVSVANQVYDFIDKHVMSLDEDLFELEEIIAAENNKIPKGKARGTDGKSQGSQLRGATAAAGGKQGGSSGGLKLKKSRRHIAIPEEEDDEDEDIEEEDEDLLGSLGESGGISEPRYCICDRPSHGQMVGCDNPECPIEWFHFQCVGLDAPPKGDWLCPVCIKAAGGAAAGQRGK